MQSNRFNYVFGMTKEDGRYLIVVRKTEDGLHSTVCRLPIEYDGKINLRVESKDGKYLFSYRTGENGDYTAACNPQDADILSTNRAGGFIGNMLGLYATSGNCL